MKFNDIELFALRSFKVPNYIIERFNNELEKENDEVRAFEMKKEFMHFGLRLNSNHNALKEMTASDKKTLD